MEVKILPSDYESYDVDAYGNRMIAGGNMEPHDCFEVAVKGTAEIIDGRHEDEEYTLRHHMYKYPSKYTHPGPALKKFHKKLEDEICVNIPNLKKQETEQNRVHRVMRQESAYKKAIRYMNRLYENFIYEKGVTSTATTAEEAMALGKGVCQDYAHILLALLRMDHIPARYVVGMLTGEGYSHAWVEVYSAGKWFGLDPTNNLLVSGEHIKISNGRDYQDCTISRGIFFGGSGQQQEIKVKVEKG